MLTHEIFRFEKDPEYDYYDEQEDKMDEFDPNILSLDAIKQV